MKHTKSFYLPSIFAVQKQVREAIFVQEILEGWRRWEVVVDWWVVGGRVGHRLIADRINHRRQPIVLMQ